MRGDRHLVEMDDFLDGMYGAGSADAVETAVSAFLARWAGDTAEALAALGGLARPLCAFQKGRGYDYAVTLIAQALAADVMLAKANAALRRDGARTLTWADMPKHERHSTVTGRPVVEMRARYSWARLLVHVIVEQPRGAVDVTD